MLLLLPLKSSPPTTLRLALNCSNNNNYTTTNNNKVDPTLPKAINQPPQLDLFFTKIYPAESASLYCCYNYYYY